MVYREIKNNIRKLKKENRKESEQVRRIKK